MQNQIHGMNSKLLLRIASVVMLLHGIGHTMGVATWQKPGGDIPARVVEIMQTEQFSFMGKEGSTMAGFYSGFGYANTVFLLFIAALLWVVSGRKEKSVIKTLWVTASAIVLLAIDEIIWFFPTAVVFCAVSATLIFISIFLINKAIR